jgi:predicted AAA+ superfamily ATPase
VPTPHLIPRRATAQVNAALADTRVVLINGARQAGKSTLVRIVAGDRPAERRDLDRAQDHAAATADPVGFVDSAELLVIDKIQRVPELLLAIKAAVDEDTRPGRYLLTGSSRLFGMAAAPTLCPAKWRRSSFGHSPRPA